MDVQAEVDREPEVVQRITAVAHRSECPSFADLLWCTESFNEVIGMMSKPGVMFTSPRRIVVFQFLAGELRYYAGGWSLSQNPSPNEYERMCAEPHELGVFATVRDALEFAEAYLVDECALSQITVVRQVRWGQQPHPDTPGKWN